MTLVITVTITIYFINPSGKLKLSFDRTTKNISHNTIIKLIPELIR